MPLILLCRLWCHGVKMSCDLNHQIFLKLLSSLLFGPLEPSARGARIHVGPECLWGPNIGSNAVEIKVADLQIDKLPQTSLL